MEGHTVRNAGYNNQTESVLAFTSFRMMGFCCVHRKGGDNTEGQSGKTSRGANSDGGYDTEEQSDSTSQGTNSEVKY